ncbi:MAG: hypothetical protein ACI4W6_02960 [Acutalibacteraceae bacterium]
MNWKEILDLVINVVTEIVRLVAKYESAQNQETLDIIDQVGELVLDGADIILGNK